jgi:hypothetical protein
LPSSFILPLTSMTRATATGSWLATMG